MVDGLENPEAPRNSRSNLSGQGYNRFQFSQGREMAQATSISLSKFTASVQAAVKAAVAKHPKFKVESRIPWLLDRGTGCGLEAPE
jgi:hypothetical protein